MNDYNSFDDAPEVYYAILGDKRFGKRYVFNSADSVMSTIDKMWRSHISCGYYQVYTNRTVIRVVNTSQNRPVFMAFRTSVITEPTMLTKQEPLPIIRDDW